ncbi:MAG: hypothetical protein DHS80DRAFT_25450 [Piptocephalis tieghemiana]|nr:MAG: hypothetical protein DHS80DRAFT_25450 [Piptocephalis tieghemiana]
MSLAQPLVSSPPTSSTPASSPLRRSSPLPFSRQNRFPLPLPHQRYIHGDWRLHSALSLPLPSPFTPVDLDDLDDHAYPYEVEGHAILTELSNPVPQEPSTPIYPSHMSSPSLSPSTTAMTTITTSSPSSSTLSSSSSSSSNDDFAEETQAALDAAWRVYLGRGHASVASREHERALGLGRLQDQDASPLSPPEAPSFPSLIISSPTSPPSFPVHRTGRRGDSMIRSSSMGNPRRGADHPQDLRSTERTETIGTVRRVFHGIRSSLGGLLGTNRDPHPPQEEGGSGRVRARRIFSAPFRARRRSPQTPGSTLTPSSPSTLSPHANGAPVQYMGFREREAELSRILGLIHSSEDDHLSYELLSTLTDLLGPAPNPGLSDAKLAKLPRDCVELLEGSSVAGCAFDRIIQGCTICLNDYLPGEDVILLPSCQHV